MLSKTFQLSQRRKNSLKLTKFARLTYRFRLSFNNTGDVATILSNLAARFSKSSQIAQLETFYATVESQFSSEAVTTAIADAKYNLQWAERNVPVIYDYMKVSSSSPKVVPIGLFILIVSFVVTLVWN